MLKRMQSNSKVDLQMHEGNLPELRDIHKVDERLVVLAKALGLANSARRPRRLNGGGIPDTSDSGMHARADELTDSRLRAGRPNGKA